MDGASGRDGAMVQERTASASRRPGKDPVLTGGRVEQQGRTASVASAVPGGRLDDEVVAGAGVAAEDAGVWGKAARWWGMRHENGERVPP